MPEVVFALNIDGTSRRMTMGPSYGLEVLFRHSLALRHQSVSKQCKQLLTNIFTFVKFPVLMQGT